MATKEELLAAIPDASEQKDLLLSAIPDAEEEQIDMPGLPGITTPPRDLHRYPGTSEYRSLTPEQN